MRNLLIFIAVLIIYFGIKRLFLSAMDAYHEERRKGSSVKGAEMVLDPECRTYVLKNRATTRRIQGKLCSFCSEACAKRYEEKHAG